MPEGHTIHNIARRHRDLFSGGPLRAWSPQGRFAEGAAKLDGRELEKAAAYGKHLFYGFGSDLYLHVHLGLIGSFRTHVSVVPDPTPATRLGLANDRATAYLSGPMTCRTVTRTEFDEVTGRLGPDPLRVGRRGLARFADALGRRRISIGAALLHQEILSGIGNVYRAELLFLCGIHPEIPANSLADDDVAALWETTVTQLRIGRRLDRIVTVAPEDVGARTRTQLDADHRLYVYRRDGLPCHRCGTEIRIMEMAGRSIWWCPTDQAR